MESSVSVSSGSSFDSAIASMQAATAKMANFNLGMQMLDMSFTSQRAIASLIPSPQGIGAVTGSGQNLNVLA